MAGQSGVIVQKRMSFLSTLVFGVTAVVMTVVLCGTGLAVYTLRVADRNGEQALHLIRDVVGDLPEISQSLPPLIADVFDHVRRPDYLEHLNIAVELVDDARRPGYQHPVLTVRNDGEQTVALLAVRIILRDAAGHIDQQIAYPATPVAIERGRDVPLPGPIFPRGTSTFPATSFPVQPGVQVEATVEVTDLRLWVANA